MDEYNDYPETYSNDIINNLNYEYLKNDDIKECLVESLDYQKNITNIVHKMRYVNEIFTKLESIDNLHKNKLSEYIKINNRHILEFDSNNKITTINSLDVSSLSFNNLIKNYINNEIDIVENILAVSFSNNDYVDILKVRIGILKEMFNMYK